MTCQLLDAMFYIACYKENNDASAGRVMVGPWSQPVTGATEVEGKTAREIGHLSRFRIPPLGFGFRAGNPTCSDPDPGDSDLSDLRDPNPLIST